MAINASHWTVTRATKVIDYIGGDHGTATASYATVIEFHRWLQGLADDASAVGDDQLDITDILPSSRATDNFITLIGGYNITDTAAEHLYDGSIVNSDGTIYDGIVNFGNVGVVIELLQNGSILADDWWNWGVGGTATGGSATTLVHTGAGWTTDQWVGYVLWNTTDGSKGLITGNTSDTLTVGEMTGGTGNDNAASDAYLISEGLNANAASGISHQFMIKVNNAGTPIDNRKLIGMNRTYLKTYGEFTINQTNRGNNVLALNDAFDLNNTTAESTVAGWTDVYMTRTASGSTVSGVNATGQANLVTSNGANFSVGDFIMTGVATDPTHYQVLSIATNTLTLDQNLNVATVGGETVYITSHGYNLIDVNNDTIDEAYYTSWNKGGKNINQFTEYMKWLTRSGATRNIYGMNPEVFRGITHELDVDGATGTFAPQESISWSGGTGQLLAINSPTAGTKIWFQLKSGVVPTDNQTITGGVTGATVLAELTGGSLIDRSSLIAKPYFGVTTGSAIIGSYGFALEKADLANTDLVFDLTNTARTPPNTVTFSVNGGVISEDYIYVAEHTGDTDTDGNPAANKNQFALNTAATSASQATIVIGNAAGDNLTIPSDSPSSGTIRVLDNLGYERRLVYTSISGGNTFNIDTTASGTEDDFSGTNASVGNLVYITYIDQLCDANPQQFSYVYGSTDRDFVIKVRDGGGTPIKESIGTGTMSNTGGSSPVSRISDV